MRVDTGVEEGGEVSLHYDPMIAKVIVHDHDRTAAAHLMADALDELAVWPVKTNGGFLRNCVLHPDFLDEKLTTGFIGERETDLVPPAVDLVAAGFAALTSMLENGDGSDYADPFAVADGWRLNATPRLGDRFEVGDDTISVMLALDDEDMNVTVGGETLHLQEIDGTGGEEGYIFRAGLDDGWVSAEIDFLEQGYLVSASGHSELYAFPHPDAAADAAEAGGVIKAPMPGKVLALNVKSGDSVSKGQALVVLEAMKMEHSLPAPRDGVIGEVAVSMGDQVADGDVLVAMQDETADA